MDNVGRHAVVNLFAFVLLFMFAAMSNAWATNDFTFTNITDCAVVIGFTVENDDTGQQVNYGPYTVNAHSPFDVQGFDSNWFVIGIVINGTPFIPPAPGTFVPALVGCAMELWGQSDWSFDLEP